ncbi:hypothetical protein GIB67_017315 [Kingdonia uniflora]|uniref:Uncharacterized protein n=1 Tax=Kingdonia uniflora TaxID=39325 RepID=A0A7J7N5L1_9MAGN|nr:hypothetical protein GIB67_017315 [Kingdonia uniflora]
MRSRIDMLGELGVVGDGLVVRGCLLQVRGGNHGRDWTRGIELSSGKVLHRVGLPSPYVSIVYDACIEDERVEPNLTSFLVSSPLPIVPFSLLDSVTPTGFIFANDSLIVPPPKLDEKLPMVPESTPMFWFCSGLMFNVANGFKSSHPSSQGFSPIRCPFGSVIIMFVEVLCAGSFMSLYIGCVHQYNSLNSQPDVLKSLYSSLQPSSFLEELRYHDGGRLSDQQMALLQYQRENIHFLSEEILRLQECLSKYERSNDGSAPQVDLAHLLAARDQELRALSAEMNQVQSELRLARNLIAERDIEIQRIHTTNNQYVEENERLRRLLGEWSAGAAKLERALKAERLSNLELQKTIATLRNQLPESSEQHGT